MFGKHRRSSNPVFVIFRLFLSLSMFGVLLFGAYSAYKHFSGVDPLKLDPQALISDVFSKLPIPISLPSKIIPSKNEEKTLESPVLFKFLLIADSHSDNKNLAKAINQAKTKSSDLAFIIGLGDYTEVGTIDELKAVKKELDSSGLRYFLVAGDHDLWDSRDKQLDPKTNFREVFGPSYQSFIYMRYKFILIDNSDNYKGFGDVQSKWITGELQRVKDENVKGILIFLHEPLFHPSSDHAMGKVEKSLKTQAESLIYQLKQANVMGVFAGDIHYFSQYGEPVTKVSMYTIGALVTERNPQLPRFAIVSVFDDGTLRVDDIEVK